MVRDETASGERAIEQSSADSTDYRFPLAIYKPVSASNVAVSIRFKAIAGRNDRAGGLIIRALDPERYYVLRANALENNVRFYRVMNSSRELIESTNLKVPSNEWHTLVLRAEADRFTASFNGQQLFTATDRTITRAGRIGLWTKSDSVIRFDRMAIQLLPTS